METIPAPLLEMAAKMWPVNAFASREAWLAYVQKWLPKLKSLNAILAKK